MYLYKKIYDCSDQVCLHTVYTSNLIIILNKWTFFQFLRLLIGQ